MIYDPVPMLPAAVYDWSGIYIGVNAGYGGGTFEHPFRADMEVRSTQFVFLTALLTLHRAVLSAVPKSATTSSMETLSMVLKLTFKPPASKARHPLILTSFAVPGAIN